MIFENEFNYLKGYVTAKVIGGDFSKMCDLMLRQGLDVFDISMSEGISLFSIRMNHYKKIRYAARISGCRVKIIKKVGIVYRILNIKNIIAILSGITAFLVFTYLLGQLVFTIDVEGLYSVPEREFLNGLKNMGLYPGMFQKNVDVEKIENEVSLMYDNISRCAVNLSYGKATVELLEKREVPESLTGHSGIITASSDGQIKRIEARGGDVVVKVGDIVKKGDILVKGITTGTKDSWVGLVKADIYAYTTKEYLIEIEKNYSVSDRTGKESKRIGIAIGDKVISVIPHNIPFQQYQSLVYRKKLDIFGVDMPFELEVTEFYETEQSKDTHNDVTLKNEIINRVAAVAVQSDIEKILRIDYEIVEEDELKIVCRVNLFCEQNISEYSEQ